MKKSTIIIAIVMFIAFAGLQIFIIRSLFVLKNRVDSVGVNTSTLQKGSNDEAGRLQDEIDGLAKRVDELNRKGETPGSWPYYVDVLRNEIKTLRMDTNAVPHGPDLVFDGVIFDMKPGDETVVAAPCGGGPDDSEMRIRSSTTGPALSLNKITKIEKGYKLDVTFGGYRQTIEYNPEDYEYDDTADGNIIYQGPRAEQANGSLTIVKILRVDSKKIFVVGQRRAC